MNKKGFEATKNTLIMGIVAIVVLITGTQLQGQVHSVVMDSVRDFDCQKNILLNTLGSFEIGFWDYETSLNDNCPKYTIKFNQTAGKIFRDDIPSRDIEYLDKTLTNYRVNQVIADEVVDCWRKFGRGAIDTFFVPRDWREGTYKSWFNDNIDAVGCRICSEIEFNLDTPEKFSGFKQYLKDSDLGTGSQQETGAKKYYELLAEHEGPPSCTDEYYWGENCWEEFAIKHNINTDPVFDSNIKYFVVFVRKNIVRNEGDLNTYVISEDKKREVCGGRTLPYNPFK